MIQNKSDHKDKNKIHLPATLEEAQKRGWEQLDIVLVTSDPHVDHPSFPANLLGRLLEASGYRVGIISRPDINNIDSIKVLGQPLLFYGVTAGTMDSMVANYTALKRIRSDDPFAPGGKAGGRPDRAITKYCNLIRRAYKKSVFIIAGGLEASLRRVAHYDYWSDSIRRPLLMDCGADILVHGMGEKPILEIAKKLNRFLKENPKGQNRSLSGKSVDVAAQVASLGDVQGVVYRTAKSSPPPANGLELPSMEQVVLDPAAFAQMHKIFESKHGELQWQNCSGMRIICNAPAPPLTTNELDWIYNLPFSRNPHPMYGKKKITALEQVRFSVITHRGCVGGCAFCSIGVHQGKTITSRSEKSIMNEIAEIISHSDFKGTIRDIGGPTANMYGLSCEKKGDCNRPSCLWPRTCKYLDKDQTRYLELLCAAEKNPKVKHLFVSTGIRTDLAVLCEPLIKKLASNHTSGLLKVAPEHAVPHVLNLMHKPEIDSFLKFNQLFQKYSKESERKQFLLPYMIAAHPGSKTEDMVRVFQFLESNGLKVEQCQIFTPTPGTASTAMYATGIDPYSGKKVFVEKKEKQKKLQKSLLLYHLPENRKKAKRMEQTMKISNKDKCKN